MIHTYFEYITTQYPAQSVHGMLLVGLTGAALNLIGQRIETRATRWRHA